MMMSCHLLLHHIVLDVSTNLFTNPNPMDAFMLLNGFSDEDIKYSERMFESQYPVLLPLKHIDLDQIIQELNQIASDLSFAKCL
jgi:hypothetical protein